MLAGKPTHLLDVSAQYTIGIPRRYGLNCNSAIGAEEIASTVPGYAAIRRLGISP